MKPGTYTVLVTPFRKNNNNDEFSESNVISKQINNIVKNCINNNNTEEIDYDSINRWMHMQYKYQIKNLVLHGTTSECPTVTEHEKIAICKHVNNVNNVIFNKWFDIYVGVGGNNTNECIIFANKIKNFCNGIMVTVPYYNKPPQRGIAAHFKTIANSIPETNVIMYNVPGRSGINMEPETMIEIINSCSNVVALKEANGDLKHCEQFVKLLKTKTNRILGHTFKLFSGDDINIVEHCKLGASGVISVASNIIPEQINNIVKYCIDNKYEKAQMLLGNAEDFIKYLFVETNPIPIKEIMYLTKIYSTNIIRLPLVTMDSEKSKNLNILYEQFLQLCKTNA